MRIPRRAAGLAAALLGTVLAAAASAPAAGVRAPAPVAGVSAPGALPARAHATTFTDDFDGPAGSAPDGSKWIHEIGDNGGNNHELQYYTDSTSNAALDGDGHLVITARKANPARYTCWYGSCRYTSARLNTAQSFSQAYGHFEARIKIPAGPGIWPAFWALGDDIGSTGWPGCGELDIMENVGFEPGTVHGTMHGPGYSGVAGPGAAHSLPDGRAFADDFHTFALDWSPGRVVWSVDGNAYQTRTPADTNGDPWVFDHPFFLILNLAVGGDWPGSPDGSTRFPARMVVDYVHASSADGAA
jgi:beta-glucanase (GH16 family)